MHGPITFGASAKETDLWSSQYRIVGSCGGQGGCAVAAKPLSRRKAPNRTILWTSAGKRPVLDRRFKGPETPGSATRRREAACKPGSVPGRTRAMAIPLGRPSPGASRDPPGRPAGNRPRVTGSHPPTLSPLLGLAPGGVCRATPVAGGAVRPYRTVSPLPAAGRPARRAVCSLWHFPWGRPRRALPGTVFPWSPDFPPPGRAPGAAIRPPRAAPHMAPSRRAHKSATASSRPMLSASSRPSTLHGRKRRWKAARITRREGSPSGLR